MSDDAPTCPDCASEFTYERGDLQVCSMCGHEWSPASAAEGDAAPVIRDAVGNVLTDGDTVTVIKDLKVKGTSVTLKRGTLIKNIRLTDDEEEIECNADKVKGLVLKTCFLKKA
jgi:protein PhnA